MFEWENRKQKLTLENFFIETFKFFKEYDSLIFKGAVIIYSQLVAEGINTDIYRTTRDVDFCNLGLDKQDLIELCKKFNDYLSSNYNMDGIQLEEDDKTLNSENNYTANWINENNKVIYNLDFSSDIFYEQKMKYLFYNVEINAYDINKIFSDKLMNISDRKIFSRFKDLIDLYNMSFIEDKLIEINKILKFNNINDKNMGNFNQLLNMYDNLHKLFTKMDYLKYKDSSEEVFSKIYSRVISIATPFLPQTNIEGFKGASWNPIEGRWEGNI